MHSSAGFYYRCINYCIVGILAYNMFELIDDYFMYYNRNICISVCRKHGINHTLYSLHVTYKNRNIPFRGRNVVAEATIYGPAKLARKLSCRAPKLIRGPGFDSLSSHLLCLFFYSCVYINSRNSFSMYFVYCFLYVL